MVATQSCHDGRDLSLAEAVRTGIVKSIRGARLEALRSLRHPSEHP